jgi:hypothetical protein
MNMGCPLLSAWPRSVAIAAVCLSFVAGCTAIDQVSFDLEQTEISLGPQDLETGGIGFLTPAAATGREADKQALAQSFSKTLAEERPAVRVMSLPRILSAVNAADLDQAYREMYRDYLETGILEGSVLRRVGEVGGVRYLAQLNLAGFDASTRGRFGFLGLRLVDTKQANMRVFLQIWDAHTGAVAWEGGVEMNFAYESGAEQPVTFLEVAELAAAKLYSVLPAPVAPDE